MEIVEYTDKWYDKWNEFCLHDSVNGTFLQTKRFLNYHPEGRFVDASILFVDNGNIMAVCPACCKLQGEEKIFISHAGSTYGGVLVAHRYYKAERLIELISELDGYLKYEGYSKSVLKITPDFLQIENSELMQFALLQNGYNEEVFLNTYVDLRHYNDDILKNLERNKQRRVRACDELGLRLEVLSTREQVEDFYRLLCASLDKFSISPVHTLEEIIMLKEDVLKNETKLFGAYKDDEMLAGSMMFYFEKTKCFHAQYISANPEYNKLSPMTYMYYKMIEYAKEHDYNYVSWGISSDHEGNINYGLTQSKEGYGSFHSLNRIYTKQLTGEK